MRASTLLSVAALGALACTTFEDPSIVHDLRILGMQASVPEQVIDVDVQDPPNADELAALLQPTTVCALVVDPGAVRRVHWRMRMCVFENDLRCEPSAADNPVLELDAATIDDPDRTMGAQPPCAVVPPSRDLANLIIAALRADPFGGFSGIDVNVELTLIPEADDGRLLGDETVVGSKALRYAARLPATRVANVNPSFDRIDAEVDGADAVALPLGRCADQAAPLTVHAGSEVKLTPIEPDGVRETYDVPTLDGGSRTFTENLSYQWLVTGGDLSRFETGGPKDGVGNAPPLDTTWRAPSVDTTRDLSLWMIQRDERLGQSWAEACLRVTP